MSDPSLKYADKVSPEHRVAMESILFAREFMGQHRGQFERLVKAESHMHDVGGLLDPTLYRDMIYSKSFSQQMRMVKAAIIFLDEVDAIARDAGLPDLEHVGAAAKRDVA